MDLNSVCFTGRLGQDPEARTVGQDNKMVVKLSVAVESGFGDKKKTNWVTVKVWGKSAEFCKQYLSKGNRVGIEGRLDQETWEKDGKKGEKLVIVASSVNNMTPQSERTGSASKASDGGDDSNEDDLPF